MCTSNCIELLIARRKHQHLQSAGKYHQLRNGMGYLRKREEGWRMQCFMKKEDTSLIDVDVDMFAATSARD